jgi:hypothetical protein
MANKLTPGEIDAKRVIDAMLESAKHHEPCILCGRATKNRDIFAPDDSQKFGAPKGKTRYIIMAVCGVHVMEGATLDEIEAIIFLRFNNPN